MLVLLLILGKSGPSRGRQVHGRDCSSTLDLHLLGEQDSAPGRAWPSRALQLHF